MKIGRCQTHCPTYLTDKPLTEPVPAGPADPMAQFTLTEREREVLGLLAAGRSNAQIATELFISPKTVEVHRASAMRRADLHSMADLVKFAIRYRLIAA